MLKIGIAKGRGLADCIRLFDNDRIYHNIIHEGKLYFKDYRYAIEVMVVRGADLVYAAENNYIDIAIGSQLLFAEETTKKMRFINSLHIGECRLALIGKSDQSQNNIKLVGTRYPKLTREKMSDSDISQELLVLSGCLESWLLNGSCDAIVDVIQTGKSLKLYDLKEMLPLGPLSHGIWLNKNKYRYLPFVKELKLRDEHLNLINHAH